MSVVVVNVSSGSTTTTLPLISSVPGGIITIKDSGSASVSNTITIVPTSGNTFQIGTYVINTPLGYITFLGFGTSWRVIATSYPNVPIYTSTISTVSGVIGPANATLNTLTVAAQTTLANTSNTGTLVVAGAATFSNTSNTGTLGVTGLTTLANSSNTGTLGVAGLTTLANSSNTGTLGVAGNATFGGFTGGAGTSFGIPNMLTIGNDSSTGFFNGSGISYGTGRYAYLRHNLGNVYGYLLADYGFLPDTWNMTYNAYTSNGAWVIPTSNIGTTRFQMTSSSFVWLYGASNVAPTTTAMTLNNGGLSVSGSLYMSLGAVGIGVVSAQSFTTEPNIENNLNNAPTNGMGKTIGFPGLSTYSGSNQQPLQITGYYGINFVGGTGNWITGASHLSIVDGKVGIQQKNPQYALDVNGTVGITSNIFSGGVRLELGSNGNSSNDIQMTFRHHDNPAVINERQFINANATMNEISVSAGCSNAGANWFPYNTAGTPLVAFMSVRKDRINFYTAYMSSSIADSSLTPTVSITYDGTGVNGSTRGNMAVSGNINVTGNATLGKYSTFLCFNNGTGYDSVRHITGNSSGFLLSDNAALGDTWNLSYNAYTSNSAWAIQNAALGTSRFLLRPGQFEWYYGGTNAAPTNLIMTLNSAGLIVYGSITGNSKNFSIPHPIVSSCTLVHASIEGPRYDLIYRNRKQLVDGSAEVDIEKESTANGSAMTPGTFDVLATNADVFLQNNDTFDRVKGYVSSHMLFIQCENSNSSAFINWMVVAERHDKHLINSGITDASGFLILEHYISTISSPSMSTPNLDEVSTLSTLSTFSTTST